MKINKLSKRTAILCGILGLLVQAACAKEQEKFKHWEAELAGGFNNYAAWEIEPSVSYRPVRYLGLVAGILLCDLLDKTGLSGESKDGQWLWNTAGNADGNHFLALRAGLQFTSPPVWLGKSKDWSLAFSVAPGMTFPIPANQQLTIDYYPNRPGVWIASRSEQVKNKGASAVFYHLKSALSLETDENIRFSIGYTFSNFDLYGGSRNITLEGKKLTAEKHAFMHSFTIAIGYRF